MSPSTALLRDALDALREIGAGVEDDDADALVTLTSAALGVGRDNDAKRLLGLLLEHHRRAECAVPLELASAMVALGLAFTRTGDAASADPILLEAARTVAAELGPRHFATAITNSALGECLAEQGRLGDAEVLLSDSYDLLHGVGGPALVETRRRLAEVYARGFAVSG